MSTLRHRQLAPTEDVLESLYGILRSAEQRLMDSDLQSGAAPVLAQSIRDVIDAVDLLADLVDRHITREHNEEES